jgi:hypothetical protein
MARARRCTPNAWACVALLAGMGMTPMASADGMDPGAPAASRVADDALALRCTLHVPPQGVAGRPVPLRMTLHNGGPRALRMLTWQTPFEGEWFAPFVAVQRDGTELPYQGPMLKRGAPAHDDYLVLPAGAGKSATLDLARAFDLSRPGRYTVQPRLRLMDVRTEGAASLASDALQPHVLDCPALQFELKAP